MAACLLGLPVVPALALAARGGARPATVPVATASRGEPAAPTGAPASPEEMEAKAKSAKILAEWRAKHPERHWDSTPAHAAKLSPNPGDEQQQTYGAFTARDERLWAESVALVVSDGHAVFHDAKRLGSPVAISCDMCHPDAANTHAETYPKYQVQLGRVAMLRDMINWCLQNPLRAKPFADDDERLKAMEAYIISQRNGHEIEVGKH